MPTRLLNRFRTVATGFGIATIFLGGAVATDLAGLRGVVFGSEQGWKVGLAVYLGTGLVFSAVQLWLVRQDRPQQPRPPRGGGKRALVPVRVTVPVRNKRR